MAFIAADLDLSLHTVGDPVESVRLAGAVVPEICAALRRYPNIYRRFTVTERCS